MTHLVGAAAAGGAVVVAADAVVGTALASAAAATSVTTRRGPAAAARASRCNVHLLQRVAVVANCGCKTGLGTASPTKAASVQNTLQTSFPLVVGEAVVVVVVWREFETARVVDAVAGPTC